MQLMCDAVAVLGSRHGVLWNPADRHAALVRFDLTEQLTRFDFRAGAVIDGVEYVFPLCAEGRLFDFCDQRTTPCTMSLIGIHGASGVKVKLTVATPFRPRDAAFSTTPVLALSLSAEAIAGQFRWTRRTQTPATVDLFIEFGGAALSLRPHGDRDVEIGFDSVRSVAVDVPAGDPPRSYWDRVVRERLQQTDLLVAVQAERRGTRLVRSVALGAGRPEALLAAWCTHSGPVLEVAGARHPFKYAAQFAGLTDVAAWARTQVVEILDNARHVDAIVGRNNAAGSVNKLLAYTLHAWLLNTWWVERNGRDWLSVWEGSCYFHSTVDVEFTQSPFYLAVWPDLLKYQLDFWPEFSQDGTATLGERGAGTLFLSHDVGFLTRAAGQEYTHPMEVEETANYLILAFAHHRRTGEEEILRRHADTIERYLAFLAACDTTGNGVPDRGVSNTIDDASPAVQYGSEQIYLAVKTLAAFECGAEILSLLGNAARAAACRGLAARIRATIDEKGWAGDHFVTLLKKDGILKNPWTGEIESWDEIPGWDAPHIYTANGLVPLDMVGFGVGLDEHRLRQDLVTATHRCLREYGCVHTDYQNTRLAGNDRMAGLAGVARDPGWISMNMVRDMAAFYRGVDLRWLADRYWDWQVTTNTQEPKLFFETFGGNNLCFYPRGVAIWGFFDALAGRVVDRAAGREKATLPFAQILVPLLDTADWTRGVCDVIDNR